MKIRNNPVRSSIQEGVGYGVVFSANGVLQSVYSNNSNLTGDKLLPSAWSFTFPPSQRGLDWYGQIDIGQWKGERPAELDEGAFYLAGTTLETFKDGGTAEEVVITYYPASKMPSAGIEWDAFDLIIDPDNYTAADIAYFAAKGVSPATKNPDGSITIVTQVRYEMSLPPPPPPSTP